MTKYENSIKVTAFIEPLTNVPGIEVHLCGERFSFTTDKAKYLRDLLEAALKSLE